MLKQYLSLELMLNNQKMEKGYDFSFNQYCDALKKHIKIDLNNNFKDLFVKNFLRRYFTLDNAFDDYDIFFDYLENAFETILPIYERRYLFILSVNEKDLLENAESEQITDTTGTQSSKAHSKNYGSQFPSELINHDSLEYANTGSVADSEGSGDSTGHSKTTTKNTVGSRLDRAEKFLSLQMNIFNDLIDEFKNLFVLVY